MSVDALPGIGDIPIKLGDKDVILKPTLNAAIKLSTQPGGLAGINKRLADLDFEAICDVIILGGGVKVDADFKQTVYESGLLNLQLPCIRFINILANGGKPMTKEDEDDSNPLAPSSP